MVEMLETYFVKAAMRKDWKAMPGPASIIELLRWLEKTKKSVCMLVSNTSGGRKRKRRKCGAAARLVHRDDDLEGVRASGSQTSRVRRRDKL